MSRSDYLAQRSAMKRGAILGAARERFAIEGYAGASVEAIALSAEVSTATLYKLFPSKLSLFGAVWRAELDAFRPLFENALSLPAREQPEAIARVYAQGLNDRTRLGLLQSMLAGVRVTPELSADFYEHVRASISWAFMRMAETLLDDGLIVCADHGEANLAAGQLMGMVEHYLLWAMLFADSRPKAPPEAIAAAAAASFWRAWGANGPPRS